MSHQAGVTAGATMLGRPAFESLEQAERGPGLLP